MGAEVEERIAFGRTMARAQIAIFEGSFGRVASQWKYDGTRVTEADLALSHSIEAAISARFPEDLFLSEELDPDGGVIALNSKYAWLVDPIDGTNNFARGIPACSISIALLEDGMPIFGFVYDHMSRGLIYGGPGRGLRVDDREIALSNDEPSAHSILGAQHCGTDRTLRHDCALQKRFKIRNFGSSAIQLAYVAAGWLDGVIAHKVNTWDIAAGVALLNAVSGRIHYFEEDPFPIGAFDVRKKTFGFLAGSPKMAVAMLDAIDSDC